MIYKMATTANYSWSTPDNTSYVKDGASSIRTLGSSVDTTLFTALGGAYPGLRLIKKQTIGSAVTSVSVTSAFSATYDNYKIVVSNCDASVGDTDILIKFNTISGSTYKGGLVYMNNANGVLGSIFGNLTNTGVSVTLTNTLTGTNFQCDVLNPFSAQTTTVVGMGSQGDNNSTIGCGGQDRLASSQTGFTLTVSSGNLTGGTIYVYGYGVS
jgi:hypothetical protein